VTPSRNFTRTSPGIQSMLLLVASKSAVRRLALREDDETAVCGDWLVTTADAVRTSAAITAERMGRGIGIGHTPCCHV
jgi:hypothetical protein